MALFEMQMRELNDRAEAAAREAGDDVVAQFSNVVEAIVLYMTYRVRHVSLDTELRHVSADSRSRYAASRKRLELMLVDLVADCVARDVFHSGDVPRDRARPSRDVPVHSALVPAGRGTDPPSRSPAATSTSPYTPSGIYYTDIAPGPPSRTSSSRRQGETMQRTLFGRDHEAYRETVREFLAREIEPNYERWESDRLIDRSAWLAAGKSGIVGLGVPEELGGSGVTDYRFRYVVAEEIARTATTSFGSGLSLQDDIAIPYIVNLGTDEQKQRLLPGMAAGELIGAIAMTEPGAGSDLQGVKTTAVRDGDEWVINGQKTFITNGIHSDLVIVVARTDPSAGSKGFSLLVVERGMPGFSRGPQAAQGRPGRSGHGRARVRGRAGARHQPARHRGPRLRSPHGKPSPRTHFDCGQRHHRREGRLPVDEGLRVRA